MKKAAIVIDSWKLSIFKQHLDLGKYIYTQSFLTKGTIWLQVKYEWVADLQKVVEAATAECLRKNSPVTED